MKGKLNFVAGLFLGICLVTGTRCSGRCGGNRDSHAESFPHLC